MIKRKTLFMASAALAVLAMGVAVPNTAKAFDDVDWDWVKDIDEDVDIDVYVDIGSANDPGVPFNPSGMVEIEKIQMNVGDVTAESTIRDIENNPPGVGEGDTVEIDEIVTITSNYDKPIGIGNSVGDVGGNVNDDGDSPVTVSYIEGTLSEQQNGFTDIIDIQLSGSIELENIEGIQDALDLPKVESVATAVGNNQSIYSEVALALHEGQYNFGDFSGDSPVVPEASLPFDTGNIHTDILLSAGMSASAGLIEKGSVTATSLVGTLNDPEGTPDESLGGILNALVDSDATAVGNNLSVELEADTDADAFVLADLTQFNFADVSATSLVAGVDVNNYTNFSGAGLGPCEGCIEGAPQLPLVSSVATAVGNNVSISVTSPDLP